MISGDRWHRLPAASKFRVKFFVNKCFVESRLKNNFLTLLVAFIVVNLFAVPKTVFGLLLPVSFACCLAVIVWSVVKIVQSDNFKSVFFSIKHPPGFQQSLGRGERFATNKKPLIDS